MAGSAYAYDGNGNLVTGNGLYFYDAQNRLTYAQVSAAGVSSGNYTITSQKSGLALDNT